MLDCILDGFIDTIKILPYLFVTFLVLEFIEHKMNKKTEKIIKKNQKLGPIYGGILGALPQCGFSAVSSNLYSSGIITMGTLIAVFLSTSDEMLAIMISETVDILLILKIIGFKVIIGIIVGFIVDLIFKIKTKTDIHHICEDDHCHCDEDNMFISSLRHCLKIASFILCANLIINIVIYLIGEDSLKNILLNGNVFKYFIASIVGLIPNCASSIIITELYISDLISLGTLFAGLLTGSGVGILLLFKNNKNLKENMMILSIIYFVGVFVGIIVDVLI